MQMEEAQLRSLTQSQMEEYQRTVGSLRDVKLEIRKLVNFFPPVLRSAAGDSVEVSLLRVFDEKDFAPLNVPIARNPNFFHGKENVSWLDVQETLKTAGASIEPTYLYNISAQPASPTSSFLKEGDMITYGDTPAEDDLELVTCNLCRKSLLKRRFVGHLERCITHPQTDPSDQANNVTYSAPPTEAGLSQSFVDQNMAALYSNPSSTPTPAPALTPQPAVTPVTSEPAKKKKKKEEPKPKPKVDTVSEVKAEEVIDPGTEKPTPTVKIKLVTKGNAAKNAPPVEPSFEDEVPLSEKEEIILVLEAVGLNRPTPLATKRTEFSSKDWSLWRLRSVISEALTRQHPKQMAAPPRQNIAANVAIPPTENTVSSALPSPSLKKKKAKGKNDDDDDDYVRKPKKKKPKIDDVSSPTSSAPPTPSLAAQSVNSSSAPSPGYFERSHSTAPHSANADSLPPSSPANFPAKGKGGKVKGDLSSPPSNTILNYFDSSNVSTPPAGRPLGRPPVHRASSSHAEGSPANIPSPSAGPKNVRKKKGEE